MNLKLDQKRKSGTRGEGGELGGPGREVWKDGKGVPALGPLPHISGVLHRSALPMWGHDLTASSPETYVAAASDTTRVTPPCGSADVFPRPINTCTPLCPSGIMHSHTHHRGPAIKDTT